MLARRVVLALPDVELGRLLLARLLRSWNAFSAGRAHPLMVSWRALEGTSTVLRRRPERMPFWGVDGTTSKRFQIVLLVGST